jgi:hypothetical protein
MGKKSRKKSKRQTSIWFSPSDPILKQEALDTPTGITRNIPADRVVQAFPPRYDDKLVGVSIMRTPDPNVSGLFLSRLDWPRRSIDQDPYVFRTEAGSGLVCHHASFQGRTVSIPQHLICSTEAETRDRLRVALSQPTSGYYWEEEVRAQREFLQDFSSDLEEYE